MKAGFTLLELQVSLFLGLVVTLIGGTLFYFEFERVIRLDRRARVNMELARIDSTAQYLFRQARAIHVENKRLLIQTRNQTWLFDERGLWRGGQPVLSDRLTVAFSDVEFEAPYLGFQLSLQYQGVNHSQSCRYLMPGRIERLP